MIKNIFLKNNKGFTIIELVISLSILSIIVLPFASGFLMAEKTRSNSKSKIVTMGYTQAISEEIKAWNLSSFSFDPNGYTSVMNYTYSFEIAVPDSITFQYQIFNKGEEVLDNGDYTNDIADIELTIGESGLYNNSISAIGTTFYLDIYKESPNYKLKVYEDANKIGVSKNYTFSKSSGDIIFDIKTEAGYTPTNVNINVECENTLSPNKVWFRIVGNKPNWLHFSNKGPNKFTEIKNYNQNKNSFILTLYEIRVTAKKDDKIIDSLVTHVKK